METAIVIVEDVCGSSISGEVKREEKLNMRLGGGA